MSSGSIPLSSNTARMADTTRELAGEVGIGSPVRECQLLEGGEEKGGFTLRPPPPVQPAGPSRVATAESA